MYAVFTQLFILVAVSDQDCSKTVGYLNYTNNDIVTEDRTFILYDDRISCEGKVTAWEFCYKIAGNNTVSFNAGVWKIIGNKFVQANSNNITFIPTSNNSDIYPCQIFNVSDTDQFTAPAGSVVGLYSNTGHMRPQLLSNNNVTSNITIYWSIGNPKDVPITNNTNKILKNYIIFIKVYLG